MATELEVRLTANIRDLQSQLKKAEKAVSNYGTKVDTQATRAGKGFTKAGKGAANAIPATQEFSRIIQDAPFGIQGVANNIQQLTANFGYLSTSAGGSVKALKLMFASLAGPAGILLAVSVVTAAWTAYAQGQFKTKSSTEKLAEATKKIAEQLVKYREKLIGVDRARLDGNRSAASELVNLRSLRSQIQNTNLSQDQRRDGIKKLQKAFPGYFNNIKEEALLNGTATESYNRLTNSILKRARANAANDILVKNLKEEFTLKQQLEDVNQKFSKNEQKRTEQEAVQAGKVVIASKGRNFEAEKLALTTAKSRDLFKEQEKIIERIGALTRENVKLQDQVTANIVVEPEVLTIDTTKIKSSVAKFKNEFINLEDVFGVTTATQNSLDKFKPNFDNFAVEFNKLGDIVGFAIKNSVDKAIPQLSRMENALKQFNGTAKDIIDNGLTDTFAGIGRAIGASLTEGGNFMNNLGKELLGALGNMITQLGELAIQTGVKMLAIKLGFASLNPALLIGAGVALVALGSVFSKGATSIGAGAGGGVAGQGSRGGGSISNNTASFGASGSGGGTVVFEIQGQKLVGVLNRTLGANARLGGNVNLGG